MRNPLEPLSTSGKRSGRSTTSPPLSYCEYVRHMWSFTGELPKVVLNTVPLNCDSRIPKPDVLPYIPVM